MKEIEQPITLFKKWLNEELALTKVRIPTAVCLSTIGTDNYPNARFVSFKEIADDSFVITGPLNSKKGIEIIENENVALTFWWTETEKQIRIQGCAKTISDALADKYFSERKRESQIISIVSNQGQELKIINDLENEFKSINSSSEGKDLKRPKSWGGFFIYPKRIEFLSFKESRFHDRKLYTKLNDEWEFMQLQP